MTRPAREDIVAETATSATRRMRRKRMDDLISRQAALDALGDMPMSWADTDAEIQAQEDWKQYREALLKLPIAEKRGEWIPVIDGNYIIWECSECHVESEAWTDFCPICGSRNIAKMEDDMR